MKDFADTIAPNPVLEPALSLGQAGRRERFDALIAMNAGSLVSASDYQYRVRDCPST
ncbi:MAG: hypothetical protein QM820_55740 [Minicystis sp.]